MADEPENLVLVYLRRIDEKIDRLTDDVRDLKLRMTSPETEVAQMHVTIAGRSSRLDRIASRLSRIEKRLDLVET